ncbi:MAG TPA: hypothetical protein VN610_00035 [Bryobacteraceae bacterium]|nr:hypothetical protein [Bryobacteraceae bacterium]
MDFSKPVFEITLPLVITIALTGWGAIFTANKRMEELGKRFDDAQVSWNKRFDEGQVSWNRRFDEVMAALRRIESKLDDHAQRIAVLEERTSPLHR